MERETDTGPILIQMEYNMWVNQRMTDSMAKAFLLFLTVLYMKVGLKTGQCTEKGHVSSPIILNLNANGTKEG